MNSHDETMRIPPPPECETCHHDRRERCGDGHIRYWCAASMLRHPGCTKHPDNQLSRFDAAPWEKKR